MKKVIFIFMLSVFMLYTSALKMSGNKLRRLVIWDCDGCLVDSEALLKQGEVEALAEAGFDLSIEECVRIFSGVSPDLATKNFLKEFGRPLPEHFFRDQIAGSMDLFRRRLQPLMLDTVMSLHAKNIPQCIASGSPRDRVELCVDVAGMRSCFPTNKIFTRELVNEGKPAPDLFLYTADVLGYKPDDCLVVEDSSSGITAALAAGMECLAFLGGGHTTSTKYRENIASFNVPTVHTQGEVLEYLLSRLQ